METKNLLPGSLYSLMACTPNDNQVLYLLMVLIAGESPYR